MLRQPGPRRNFSTPFPAASPFLCTLRKRIVSDRPLLKPARHEKVAEGMCSSSPRRHEGPFHTKRNMKFYGYGATSGCNVTVATRAAHCPASAEFTTFLGDLRALEFGKQNRCLLLWGQGWGTVLLFPLPVVKDLGGSGMPASSCFGFVPWKR